MTKQQLEDLLKITDDRIKYFENWREEGNHDDFADFVAVNEGAEGFDEDSELVRQAFLKALRLRRINLLKGLECFTDDNYTLEEIKRTIDTLADIKSSLSIFEDDSDDSWIRSAIETLLTDCRDLNHYCVYLDSEVKNVQDAILGIACERHGKYMDRLRYLTADL